MRCFGLVIDGRAQASGIRRPASDATLLLVLNAHHDVVELHAAGHPRRRSMDLACSIPTCRCAMNCRPIRPATSYQVTGRSLLLFALDAPSRATQRVLDRLEEQLTLTTNDADKAA